MNTQLYSGSNTLTARFVAIITTVSLLLSAFPAAFLVANAANVDAVGDVTVTVLPDADPAADSVGEYFTVTFSGTGTLNLDGWVLDDGDNALAYPFVGVSLTNGDSFKVCANATSTENGGMTDCDANWGGGAKFDNNGDDVTLIDDSSAVVVDFTYGAASVNELFSDTDDVFYAPKTETEIDVYGNTSTFYDEPGTWLFNRDVSTATEFEFNTDEQTTGNGAVYVEPIDGSLNGAADKFIGELFVHQLLSDITTITYDYQLGPAASPSDANEFYANVYVNFDDSDNFGHCVYNVVPTDGSAGWHTATFDPAMSYSVRTRGSAPSTCPATPADLPDTAELRMFAINLGDTSANDAGVDGYFDTVVVENDTSIVTYDLEPDVTKPTVAIDAPANSAVVGADFTVQGTAADVNDIEEVSYTVTEIDALGGSYVANIDSGMTNGTSTWDFDVSGLSEGFYRLKVKAVDTFGNFKFRYHDVEVDLTKPNVTITSPANGDTLDNVAFTVTGTAEDEKTDISKVLFTVTEITALGGTYLDTIATGTANGTESWSFDVQSLDNGFYRLKVQAFDAVGNWKYRFHDVVVDGTKPSVEITYPANGAVLEQDPFTVTGTASDDEGDIVEVKYTVNEISAIGGTYVASVDTGVAVGTEAWSFGVGTLDEGFYRLKVQAFDENGNWRYKYHDIEIQEFEAILNILTPSVAELVAGTYDFTAEYIDDDETEDLIQWAIRADSCAANASANVAGNVGSYSDASTFQNGLFSTTLDSTDWDNGDYCFVVNPKEGPGEDDLRATQLFEVNNIQLAAHCGDGLLNQDWEMCEVGDEGCTNYCTWENQCTDLQLVKVDFAEDAPASESFEPYVYLGSATNVIPSGAWFNFNEVGDDSYVSIANAANGLAVQRDTDTGKLAIGFAGDNGRNQIDYVQGTIETKGIVFGDVEREPNPSFNLEPTDGSGGFPDLFAVTDASIEFDLRADTGDDGVTVEIEAGEEYNCPFVETKTISGYKFESGESESTPVPNWTIYAGNGLATTSANTTDSGYYSFEVVGDNWVVYEDLPTGTQQDAVYQNDLLVDTGAEAEVCRFDFSETESSTGACDFYNSPEVTTLIPTILPQSTGGGGGGGQTGTLVDARVTNLLTDPAPIVRGDSVSQCQFLDDYMRMGIANDFIEVSKLQLFLATIMGYDQPVTGYFGSITHENVKQFQEAYQSEVLDPWYLKGLASDTSATGYVYLLTKWKIDDIVCQGTATYPKIEDEV